MENSRFQNPLSDHLWHTQYQYLEGGHYQEPSIEATWDRLALAAAGVETQHQDDWRERFKTMLNDFRFLPDSQILAVAGTPRRATLFNAFVASPMEDSIQGIFNALREAMLTLQAGGGLGIDFSTLRPAGLPALASGGFASGPVSFMKVWDVAASVLGAGTGRPGALMATLRCDHPDIDAFIEAQTADNRFQHFKLSVAVTDDFMQALAQDGPWALVFPLGDNPIPPGGEVCERIVAGSPQPQLCMVHRRVPARALWDKLLEAEHACAEPSVLYVDRINRDNNLWYGEHLASAGPCTAPPLPADGGCPFGAINLTRFVQHPFTAHPHLDLVGIKAVAGMATRFLDNMHELSAFALKNQEKVSHANRRIGLGITGLADMFLMLGLRYGSQASLNLAEKIMETVRDAAYRTSVGIAREKTPFPAYDPLKFGASPFVLGLPRELQEDMARHGMRNSHLLAQTSSPATSLLANNISPGIAPVMAFESVHEAVSAEDQLRMAAAVQSYVDSAVVATVTLPGTATAHEVGLVHLQAQELGLKACTVRRLT